MKNTIRIVLCAVLVLGVLFSFSACGGSEQAVFTDDTAVKQYVTGRYELKTIKREDGTVTSGDILQQAEDAMGDMYVELFSDGTAQLALYGQIKDMEFSDDEMWNIDYANESYDFSVRNGKVTLNDSGDTYVFVKK